MNPQLSLYARFEHGVRRHASKWLFRLRGPEPGEVFLSQRRVFIIPSHPGLLFCALLVTLFIGSVNYNLSLGFGLTFLLASCGLIDMLLTFRNLAHLRLVPGRAQPVFAGEEAQFELHLVNRRGKDRHAIWLDFVHDDREPDQPQATDVAGNATSTVLLATPTPKRGWLQAPRVRLQTRFPLGLLRAWTYWQPDVKALVYPRPEEDCPPLPQAGMDESNQGRAAGHDDFAGIRAYQSGDSPRRLAWRQIARLDPTAEGNLITKQFEGGGAGAIMLDLALLPGRLDLESALSRLTRWAIEAEARSMPYALRLGAVNLPAALGPAHRAACLRALALHPGTG